MPIRTPLSSAIEKKVIVILFGSLLLSLIGNYFHPEGLKLLPVHAKPGLTRNIPDHFDFVSAEDAAREVSLGRGIIVDIRSAEEYGASHPQNSVNLPYHKLGSAYNEAADELPRGMNVFILCEGRQCGMSERVALKLAEYGLKNAAIIKQTFDEWKNLGFPVE